MDMDTSEDSCDVSDNPSRNEINIQIHRSWSGQEITKIQPRHHYWKITILLGVVMRLFDVFVPPEWKSLPPMILATWVETLRRRPFETITLGGITYRWTSDILLPQGQSIYKVPIPGRNGLPDQKEPTTIWNHPLKPEAQLHIGLNRIIPESFNLQELTHYWELILPRTTDRRVQKRRTIWVPPEWRMVPLNTLQEWMKKIVQKQPRIFEIGGTYYRIRTDTLYPVGQTFINIRYYQDQLDQQNPLVENIIHNLLRHHLRPVDLTTKYTSNILPTVFGRKQATLEPKLKCEPLEPCLAMIPSRRAPPPFHVPLARANEPRCRCPAKLPTHLTSGETNSDNYFVQSSTYPPSNPQYNNSKNNAIKSEPEEDPEIEILSHSSYGTQLDTPLSLPDYEKETEEYLIGSSRNRMSDAPKHELVDAKINEISTDVDETEITHKHFSPIPLIRCGMHYSPETTINAPINDSASVDSKKRDEGIINHNHKSNYGTSGNTLPSIWIIFEAINKK